MNSNAALASKITSVPGHPHGHGASMDRMVAWLHEPARRLHGMIREIPGFAPLRHVSLSVYDPQLDMLWAFSCNSDAFGTPEVTEIEMTDVPSLVLLADGNEPRIIADMAAFGDEGRHHTNWARNSGSRSCMTVPINLDGHFLGFVIFGAGATNFFGPQVCDTLRTFTEAFGILIDRARHLSE
jgi:hypothetical protein